MNWKSKLVGFVFAFCTFILLLCIALSMLLLQQLPTKFGEKVPTFLQELPINSFLNRERAWLFRNFHLNANIFETAGHTTRVELLIIVFVFLLFYLGAAWLASRDMSRKQQRLIYGLIWFGAIAMGLMFLLTPALPSHDLFIYADYGRAMTVHGANLYFVPPSSLPPDRILLLDDWRTSTSAYGPVWLFFCALVSWFVNSDSPVRYLFVYRGLGLVFHLINIGLIFVIFQRLRSSARIALPGALLYAWSPFALLQSCLTSHNDIVICTLLLLGVLFSVFVYQNNTIQARFYVPAVLAFTLATLIKITVAPVIICFCCFLVFKAMTTEDGQFRWSRWSLAIRPLFIASAAGLFVGILAYLPFWLGHDMTHIMQSFSAPPSSKQARFSILSLIQDKFYQKKIPTSPAWFHSLLVWLDNRQIWDKIIVVTLLLMLTISALRLWRKPDIATLVLTMLLVQAGFLVVTPWFHSWYHLELIVLLPLLLLQPITTARKNMFVFVLVITFTSLLSEYQIEYYIAHYYKEGVDTYSAVFVPAICAYVISWVYNLINDSVQKSIASKNAFVQRDAPQVKLQQVEA